MALGFDGIAGRNIIMDTIHGAIGLYDHEIKIIDHPLFQRLRHILQNDVLHMTFVGSTHTRLAHSIGTCHVAGKIFMQLVSEQVYAFRSKSGERVTQEQEDAFKYIGDCLRLALLLHDTGHGAFSHQAERSARIKALLQNEGVARDMWSGIDTREFYEDVPLSLHHEHFSIRVAHKIMSDVGENEIGVRIPDVLNIMEGTDGAVSDQWVEMASAVWPILSLSMDDTLSKRQRAEHVRHLMRCIVSGEFDADKADYLLRDSMYTGVNYGKFDLDTLISSLGVAWVPEQGWFGLTIKQKGIGCLEDMIHCRFQMYMHVYRHKTTNGMELLLHMAINEFMEDEGNTVLVRRFLTDVDEFVYFTDDFFWERFRERARKDKRSFAHSIIARKKLKHLGTFYNLSKQEQADKQRELADELSVSHDVIHVSNNKTKFSKISPDFTDIRVSVKDTLSGKVEIKDIYELSDFFTKFQDNEISAYHLFPDAE